MPNLDQLTPGLLRTSLVDTDNPDNLRASLVTDAYPGGIPQPGDLRPSLVAENGDLKPGLMEADGYLNRSLYKPGVDPTGNTLIDDAGDNVIDDSTNQLTTFNV